MSTINPLAPGTRQQLAQEGVAFSGPIATAARRHGLDPELLAAVAAQETGGPGSNAGANIVGDGGHGRGLFQIDDRWHQFAKTAGAMDPVKNAEYAAGMLSGLLRQYGGNIHKALSAYNAGAPNATGTTTRWADGQKLGYADSVLRHYRQLHGATASKSAAVGADASGEIFSEMRSVNQLQSLARAMPQAAPAQTVQPAGRSNHPKQTSWAGFLAPDDSESTP